MHSFRFFVFFVALLLNQISYGQSKRAVIGQPEHRVLFNGMKNRVEVAMVNGGEEFLLQGDGLAVMEVDKGKGLYDLLVRGADSATLFFFDSKTGDTLSRHSFVVRNIPDVLISLDGTKNGDALPPDLKGEISVQFVQDTPLLELPASPGRWVLTIIETSEVFEGKDGLLSLQAIQAVQAAKPGSKIALDGFYSLPGTSERLIRASFVKN
jgi:hypothetical protein